MIEIGKTKTLKIVKEVSFGVYLAESADDPDKVLLPLKEVPKHAKAGDAVEVFLYRDSEDRPIATMKTPAVQLGGVAVLRVSSVTGIGAFLDWGLEKDLFLPFKQQTRKVRVGDACLVALYLDKSGRLCATMNVYPYLRADSPYKKDDRVQGTIYETSGQFGIFVAVDNAYLAIIPRSEASGTYRVGDVISARVTSVRPDGKLNLSTREKAYLQMDADAELVYRAIEEQGGELPFTDKASPERIQEAFGLSKNAFKRAVGRLLKEGRVTITDQSIRKVK